MMRSWLMLAAAPLAAQNISFGVRAGVPLTHVVETAKEGLNGFEHKPNRWVLGPTVEVRLPLGVGFTVDALYRRLTYDVLGTTINSGTGREEPVVLGQSHGLWQFPVMLKYRAGVGPFRPFVAGGVSFSRITGIAAAGNCVVSLGRRCAVLSMKDSSTGLTFGAGLDAKLPGIRLAPEIRYTRIGSAYLQSESPSLLSSRRNQFEFLLGITF